MPSLSSSQKFSKQQSQIKIDSDILVESIQVAKKYANPNSILNSTQEEFNQIFSPTKSKYYSKL